MLLIAVFIMIRQRQEEGEEDEEDSHKEAISDSIVEPWEESTTNGRTPSGQEIPTIDLTHSGLDQQNVVPKAKLASRPFSWNDLYQAPQSRQRPVRTVVGEPVSGNFGNQYGLPSVRGTFQPAPTQPRHHRNRPRRGNHERE